MTALWPFLIAAVWPLAKKVLLMLGIGWLTYEGLNTLIGSVISAAQSNFGQMTGATLQIVSLAGVPEVFGIISGALVARVALIAVGKLGKVTA